MTTVTVSSRGQVVIPKALREQYHLKEKATLACLDTGRGLFLVPIAKDPIKATRGMLRGGPSLTKSLLEERRRDREVEERKLRRWLR
jgi:AbrB family looped-hinge helix DNA binding protein